MFYSYTRGEHKNMLVRFPLKINAPSSCYYLSKFCCRTKVIRKKEKKKMMTKKKNEKNGHKSVRDIENNGYLDARLK